MKRIVKCKCGSDLLEVVIDVQEVRIHRIGGDICDTEFHCRNCDREWELLLNRVQTEAIDMATVFEEETIPLFR